MQKILQIQMGKQKKNIVEFSSTAAFSRDF